MLWYNNNSTYNYSINDHTAGEPQWAYTTHTSHRVASGTCASNKNRTSCVDAATNENNPENKPNPPQMSTWWQTTRW